MKKIVLLFFVSIFLFAQKPEIMLLETYNNQNVTDYLMSEKLDGIRAYWDGKNLISRNGNIFYAPKWFIKDFPNFPLDGELYTKRGDFENIISIVSKKYPHEGWQQLKFYVFDVPTKNGGLLQRLDNLKDINSSYMQIVQQFTCKNKDELLKFFDEIVKNNGEGVVIRDPNMSYIPKRSSYNLKLKLNNDAECKITKIHRKNKIISSFNCLLDNEKEIKIGSGMSDDIRKNNILIEGMEVTFKYNGFTNNGMPKFPVFSRIRNNI